MKRHFPWSGSIALMALNLLTPNVNAQNPVYYNPDRTKPAVANLQTDVCIYGGTSAGVAAALQLSRDGKKAIIIEPSAHLGGLSAGGLGETDIGNKSAIGGISHEFYQRVGKKYGVNEEWRFEPHIAEQVFNEMVAEAKTPVYYRQFLKSVKKQGNTILSVTFESGLTVSAKEFIDATYEGDLMAQAGVDYHVGRESNATFGETLNGVQIQNLHQWDLPVDPYVVAGDPASGLLPSVSAVPPAPIGSGDKKIQAYNFRLCLTDDPANRIPFEKPAGYNPQEYVLLGRYLQAGWPESEVFRKFDPIRNSFKGEETLSAAPLQSSDFADAKSFAGKVKKSGGPFTKYLKAQFPADLQAQLDALGATDKPSDGLVASLIEQLNRIIQGPSLYTPELFAKVVLRPQTTELLKQNPTGPDLLRLNRALLQDAYSKEFGTKSYGKVDKNNHGALSTDYIGQNYDYPEADYATREKIFQAHVTYQKGLMWFLGNDASVPANIRSRWNQWGLAKDEFTQTGGWPHALYVREARRLMGDYVMTEHNCRGQEVATDSIGLAAYTMDSHNVERFVHDGHVRNEGDVQEKNVLPYPISYRAIVPKEVQCANLLVPVCLSASHIAYGSIRMEPVFMITGQSAALAASLAIDKNVPVQKVPYADLQAKLMAEKQILKWAKPATVTPVANIDTDPNAALKAFFGRLKAGQKQTVDVYGTSLTHNGAWTGALNDWFKQQFPGQVTFYNSGISGKNSDDGLAQIQEQVLSKKPDLVFIEFAINDAATKFNMPVEKGASNLDQIVKAIRAQNPDAAIVLQIMSLPWDAPNGNQSFSIRPQLGAFNENYRVYAKEHALPLIDHNPDWKKLINTDTDKYHLYLPDGLHPNRVGDLAITWPPIAAFLSQMKDAG